LDFANAATNRGWQVLSVDLPKHGERALEKRSFVPWEVIPDLHYIMDFAKCNWGKISLCANSIGAWFSLLGFSNEQIENCFFISPVLDMQRLITNMMSWANVSEKQLQQEKIIPTSFGNDLSWKYLM
jgi:alpha-beta hydrolase superfamily lysophospholipase